MAQTSPVPVGEVLAEVLPEILSRGAHAEVSAESHAGKFPGEPLVPLPPTEDEDDGEAGAPAIVEPAPEPEPAHAATDHDRIVAALRSRPTVAPDVEGWYWVVRENDDECFEARLEPVLHGDFLAHVCTEDHRGVPVRLLMPASGELTEVGVSWRVVARFLPKAAEDVPAGPIGSMSEPLREKALAALAESARLAGETFDVQEIKDVRQADANILASRMRANREPEESVEAVEPKSRKKPSRLGWRDDPKAVVEMFEHDCDMLAQSFDALPDLVDRMKRKHREKVSSALWNLFFEVLASFEEMGAISHEQRERIFDELSAALDNFGEKTISDRIVAAVQKRHSEGETYGFVGYETVKAARKACKKAKADTFDAKGISLVVYESNEAAA